ncbi:MAG: glutamine--fructose-6-phosphate transaminase (isomerizing) [Candidatus Parvarchaeota archaeon]|nr:glutamine--fructose-6-phosphate transaminase (isomerizing) [Candidatus Jingweiarchaeum tengchongense]MCW1298515.1 glutamine--fructose-6-phosphate transaminase (isomerizing) [Candidatus Jingweiarchaeum tengchongense]MCW1300239.1 glutamine--fructose-6-phosphate transaminase (isomerizing) [Candidatus Jingweiarchaeum tengchongense]MCW1304527.1 glutamine--fructose-6-phosphate transaminase (isomerizing) [Candidatus Jingweiarchaeum tengchongense]MCW1305745.1 glutamine--fructose-6-phosphate transami
MCGIIGYFGNRNAAPIILEGLRRLEYRGYDSAGMAIITNNGVKIKKDVGKVDEIHARLNFLEHEGNIAIGHTRWATHGGVTRENAHPHISNNGKIVIVHNGIIENFQEQRKFLTSQGFKFYSQTDTETIPNTIEYHMRRGYDFFEAVKRSLRHLDGQYAIVLIHEDEKKLVAVRKEAPLVIGVGEGEYFVASDIPAFLEHTKNVIFLEEKDMVMIDKDGLKIFNLIKDSFVERPIVSIDWNAEQAKKGEFDHFFMKEIVEQTEVISRIAKLEDGLIKDIADEIRKAKGTYIVACGTAAHASMHGVYLFSRIAKKHINFCIASEFPHFKHFLTPESLVIAVSQSGETADTLAAIRAAKSAGAKVISITNVMGSTLMRESDKSILQRAGPEICVVSTKAYTSQLAILYLLACELAGKLDEGKEKIRELGRYIYYLTSINMRKYLKQLAEKLRYTEHLYLIGRGLQYPTALEAALKIKEVSYIHAEAYAGGELKHGTIALIEHGTPCIVFTSEENEKEIISNAMELKARGAYIIGVGPRNNDVFDFFIKVREAGELNSICQIIPMQILAYQLAILRGCDPDKPRNLAKAVVVK